MAKSRTPMDDVLSTAALRAAGAAQRIGVFEALSNGPLTPAETAQRLGSDARGVDLLLGTLEVFGYVTRQNGHYANSPTLADWLPAFDFWGTILFQLWEDLEQSIRNGQPPLDFYQWLEQHPAARQNFQGLLRSIAQNAAPEVVEKVKLPQKARRLLDIGGSHAEYSAAFCRRYLQLSATVFDFPGALEAAAEHVSDRISLQPGNFLTDDLGRGYDVALLMSVVHGHLPETNIELLRKVANALNPGGRVVILEQLAGATTPNAFNRVFSLNLFHLQGGQTYSFEEIAEWLNAAGFAKPKCIKLRQSPGDSVIVART